MKLNLKEVWSIIRPKEKKQIILSTFFQIISGLFDMLGVLSILPFLSILTNPDLISTNTYLIYLSEKLDLQYKELLLFLGLLSVLIILINQFFRIFSNWYSSYISHSIWLNLTSRMFYFFLTRKYSYYLQNNTYSLLEKISNQVNSAQAGVIEPIYKLVNHFFSFIFIFFSLIYIEPIIILVTFFVLLLVYFLFFKMLKNKLESLGTTEPDTFKKIYNLYGDAFGAIKEIKIAHNEDYYKRVFMPLGKKHIKAQITKKLIIDFPNGLIEILSFGGIIALTIFLIFSTKNFASTISTLALLGFALKRIIPSINGIYQQIGNIKFYQASFESIKSELILAKSDLEKDLSIPIKDEIINFNNIIKLKNVSFRHQNADRDILKDINLLIKKGDFIGIIGSTGSGKSTLIDLIAGLSAPSVGDIFIDEKKLKEENYKSWHNSIGYVDQTGFLSDDSIKKNIAIGVDERNINIERIKEAAKIANIFDFIENELPNKYNTIIGERGQRLSGGQRQRIRIARAIYKNPKILILDEATNALDSHTEEGVITSIKNNFPNMTIIMVNHRVSALKSCNKIFKIQNNKISKELTFDEIKKN